jgi:hypothetical protein
MTFTMKRIFRELGYFFLLWLVVSILWGLAQFAYERWPAQLFVGLGIALMYALFRFASWLSDAGGLQ